MGLEMESERGRSTQHSALSTQHSALSTQHSALSTQHSALSTQHSALSTQHSALSTQHSALSTQHSVPLPLDQHVAAVYPTASNCSKLSSSRSGWIIWQFLEGTCPSHIPSSGSITGLRDGWHTVRTKFHFVHHARCRFGQGCVGG